MIASTGAEALPGGRYFSNGKAVQSSGQSYQEALQRELWLSSARMTGLPADLTSPARPCHVDAALAPMG